jgi:hypothetical protein
MVIDCDRCVMRGTACQDCVVAVLEPRNVAGYLGAAEVRALGVLADAGMVPPLRLKLADSRILPGARTRIQNVFPDRKAS